MGPTIFAAAAGDAASREVQAPLHRCPRRPNRQSGRPRVWVRSLLGANHRRPPLLLPPRG
jgi:hypothetical protein